ncbi:MAG: trigger factor [Mariprofundaceae bacterium]|nr:trigger factor [Mariprofundaceae bacterium]
MIQINVKQLSDNEHQVHVTLPQSEYDRVYAEHTNKLSGQAKLPGFRPGKTPAKVIKKQFGPKLHEDTVSELLQAHYVGAIESSGLAPAIQPELSMPAVQPDGEFTFILNVVTWPKVDVEKLSKLKFDEVTVNVEDADVDAVVERLQKSQVKYDVEDGRVAENGDQVTIDFVGFVDNEAFDGGDGEEHALILGSGQFIPGFEEQLVGSKAGDHITVNVSFPEAYQAAHLAGKEARFETDVKSVAKPETAEDDDALAKMLGFDDAAALRADAQERLDKEAKEASFQVTRDAALDALLAANVMTIPGRLLEEEIKNTTQRVMQNMQQQGMEANNEMFADEAFKKEVRERAERSLKLSVLIQAVREKAEIELDETAVEEELELMSKQHPAEQHDQFIAWIKDQKEQMAGIRDRLLEQRCVTHIVAEAKTKSVSKALSEWQKERDDQA